MVISPDLFVEKQWKRPLRIAAEQAYARFGSLVFELGLARDCPRNPVFIVGSPRSGTSIFNIMISTNPDIADLSEAIYIWEPGDRDHSSSHIKTAADVTPAHIARIRGAFGFYQRMKGKRYFVNKNPRSSVRIGFIQAIFPEAYFIHIVRDGRAVVNSILGIIKRERYRQKIPLGGFCKPRNWRELLAMPPLERHAAQWAGIMKEIDTSKRAVPEDRWIEIKYEELCSDPCRHLEDIYCRIGIPADGKTLEQIKGMARSQNYKWLQKYSVEDIELMNGIMKEPLKRYRYI